MSKSLDQVIKETEKKVKKMQRTYRHIKEEHKVEKRLELLEKIQGCIGELAECQVILRLNVCQQAAKVCEGRKKGFDTSLEEKILKESSLGYLLADETIYALRAIASYEDLNLACRAMERIVDMISKQENNPNANKKDLLGRVSKMPKDGFGVARSTYNDVASEKKVLSHNDMIDGFFERLIETGDLVSLIDEAREQSYYQRMANNAGTGEGASDTENAKDEANDAGGEFADNAAERSAVQTDNPEDWED